MPIGRDNYEDFAERYTRIAADKLHNAYYNLPALEGMMDSVDNRAVFDAGCGPGFLTRRLIDGGATVTACDATPQFVEICRERCPDAYRIFEHNLEEPLRFAEDESFDLIVSSLVLNYIEDWRPLFREFARVLKVGGSFIASVDHPQGTFLRLRDRRGRPPHYFETERFSEAWTGFGEPSPVITSYRRSLEETLNPICEAGLKIDMLREPRPIAEAKAKDPQIYKRLMELPDFLCIKASKPNRV